MDIAGRMVVVTGAASGIAILAALRTGEAEVVPGRSSAERRRPCS